MTTEELVLFHHSITDSYFANVQSAFLQPKMPCRS
jgi:hypothetical protein